MEYVNGAEILALTLGGTIRKTKFIQKGNETIKILQNNLLTNNSIDVFESHGFENFSITRHIDTNWKI